MCSQLSLTVPLTEQIKRSSRARSKKSIARLQEKDDPEQPITDFPVIRKKVRVYISSRSLHCGNYDVSLLFFCSCFLVFFNQNTPHDPYFHNYKFPAPITFSPRKERVHMSQKIQPIIFPSVISSSAFRAWIFEHATLSDKFNIRTLRVGSDSALYTHREYSVFTFDKLGVIKPSLPRACKHEFPHTRPNSFTPNFTTRL